MGNFSLDMSKFKAKSEKQLSQVVRKTAFGLFSAIQRGTPIDTANARFSWFISMNSFSNRVVDNRAGKASDEATASEMDVTILSELGRYKSGDTITMTNNSDHIEVLEYGLFAWSDSAKVTNHFSSQAVGGFVRLNVQKFQTFVNNATKGLS